MTHSSKQFRILFVILTGLFLFGFGTASCAFAGRQFQLPPNAKAYRLKGTSQTIPVSQLSEIKAGSAWKVILTQGSVPSVRLEYDEGIARDLIVGVGGGTLYLYCDTSGKLFKSNKKRIAYITVTDLRDVKLSSASTLEVKNTLTSRGEFELELSGASEAKNFKVECKDFSADLSGASELSGVIKCAGKVEVDLSGASSATLDNALVSRELDADLSGASNLGLKGTANRVSLDLSGASELHAKAFVAKDCEIEASGASEAEITVRGAVSLDVSGASTVDVWGKPAINSMKSSGSSDVNVH